MTQINTTIYLSHIGLNWQMYRLIFQDKQINLKQCSDIFILILNRRSHLRIASLRLFWILTWTRSWYFQNSVMTSSCLQHTLGYTTLFATFTVPTDRQVNNSLTLSPRNSTFRYSNLQEEVHLEKKFRECNADWTTFSNSKMREC